MRMNEVEVFKADSTDCLFALCVSPEFTAVSHIISFGVNTPSDAHLGDVARRCQKCKATRLSPNPSHNILQFFWKMWGK